MTSPAQDGHTVMLDQRQADAMVRVVEAAPAVRRRHQYFVWTQSQLQTLLPHQLQVCGAYVRQRRDLVFEALHSVVLPPALLAELTDAQGPLLRALQGSWVDGGNQALRLTAAQLARTVPPATLQQLGAVGIDTLLVHGVARPQRPAEVESFFVLGQVAADATERTTRHLELLLPYLHASWQRVVATEREMGLPATTPKAAPVAEAGAGNVRITEREREVLKGVADGKNNEEIGRSLGISPLTVKNHVQKILRKMDCSNRAQAVAQALSLGLLRGNGPH